MQVLCLIDVDNVDSLMFTSEASTSVVVLPIFSIYLLIAMSTSLNEASQRLWIR